jgi:hypothetical protein
MYNCYLIGTRVPGGVFTSIPKMQCLYFFQSQSGNFCYISSSFGIYFCGHFVFFNHFGILYQDAYVFGHNYSNDYCLQTKYFEEIYIGTFSAGFLE